MEETGTYQVPTGGGPAPPGDPWAALLGDGGATPAQLAYFEALWDCTYISQYLARGPYVLAHHTYHELCHAALSMREADKRWHQAHPAESAACPYCREGDLIGQVLRLDPWSSG